jgi:hypothetical protein
MNITPKHAVLVSNEVFHNGNVEAWINIIESYQARFPDLQVSVFHRGERVANLNSLFKWGKVKHGDAIEFSVAGPEIQGVSKLKLYLTEGASRNFMSYLKRDQNKLLPLF